MLIYFLDMELATHGHHRYHHAGRFVTHVVRHAGRYVSNYAKQTLKNWAHNSGGVRGMKRYRDGSRAGSTSTTRDTDDNMGGGNGVGTFGAGAAIGSRWKPKRESKGHKRRRIGVIRKARQAAYALAKPFTMIEDSYRCYLFNLIGAQGVTVPPPLYTYFGTDDAATVSNTKGNNDTIFGLAGRMNLTTVLSGGTSGAPTLPSQNIYQGKLHMRSAVMNCELRLGEAEVTPVYIDIWDYVARHGKSGAAAFQSMSTIVNDTDPAATGNLALAASNLQWTPFNSTDFVRAFKILGKRTVCLTPGSTLEWKYSGRRGVIDCGEFNGVATGDQISYPGWTRGIIMVIMGSTGYVSGAPPTPSIATAIPALTGKGCCYYQQATYLSKFVMAEVSDQATLQQVVA